MALAFRQTGSVKVTATWTDSGDLSDVVETAVINPPLALENGTGSNQANCLWQHQGSVASSSTASYSLASLSTSVYGGTGALAVSAVKVLYFINTGEMPLRLAGWPALVSSHGGDAWINVEPGAFALLAAPTSGWASSPGSQVSVSNQGLSGGTFSIALIGTTALE